MEKDRMGQYIAQCRKKRGMNQKELANLLHVTEQAVSRWERGIGYPEITLLLPLAQALHVSVVELMEGRDLEDKVEKQAVEHSLTYYMAQGLEERKPLRKAMLGMMAYLYFFIFCGWMLISLEAGSAWGLSLVTVLGFYLSAGGLIAVFLIEGIMKMAVEYGVVAKRNYRYQPVEDGKEETARTQIVPISLDGGISSDLAVLILAKNDGREMGTGELLFGLGKAAGICGAIFFWWCMMDECTAYGTLEEVFIPSFLIFELPFALVGGGMVIAGIWSYLCRRNQGGEAEYTLRQTGIRIAAGIAVMILSAVFAVVGITWSLS